MLTELLLVECKITGHASIALKQSHLIKITREAALQMKSPAMVLSFPVMPSGVDSDWALVSLSFLTAALTKAGLMVPEGLGRGGS